ncbi:hypothetical protein SteCoe_10914 [Stentor coeruleus]|uniref:Rab-GAP TBC domain-containing protein n=1 Tax=Stentor coeruleus TaxID=5963 RepID=A0A1R2CEN0_9CILI|nr:hypothetical protein SteCoe_10914 [Stentor coeruleus]
MNKEGLSMFSKTVLGPLLQGVEQIDMLLAMFKNIDTAFEDHHKAIAKIHSNFILDENDQNPLSKALFSVKSYLYDYTNGLLELLNHIKHDIEDPLVLYSEIIRKTINELEIETKCSVDTLNLCYKKFEDCKIAYYKNSETYEGMCNMEIKESHRTSFALNKDKMKLTIEEDMIKFLSAEQQANEYLEIFTTETMKILQQIKKNEESRVYFTKTIAEKYLFYAGVYYKILQDSIQNISKKFQNVSCLYDSDEVIRKIQNFMPKKIIAETYKDYMIRTGPPALQESEIISRTLDLLLEKKESDAANCERMMQILDSTNGKEQFIIELEKRKWKRSIGLVEITKLAEMFKKIINELGSSERSNVLFITLLDIAERIHTKYKGKKKFLYEFLIADSNLNEDSRWLNVIETIIERKLNYELKLTEKKLRSHKSQGFFRKLANKLSTSKESSINIIERKIAVEVLNDISMKMWRYAIDFSMAKSVIQTFAIKYEIASELVIEILSLLHQPSSVYKKKRRSFMVTIVLPFQLALPYLSPQECIPLLFLKKSCNEILKMRIYKKCLIEIQPKSIEIRKSLWINALKDYFPKKTYDELAGLCKNQEIIEKYYYIIDMDVFRSYQDNIDIQDGLKRILKVYAAYNPSIGYCQGMNFIAGTFLILFEDESVAFMLFCAFLEKFKMKELLGESMKRLKCFFYQLDKLAEMKFPKFYSILVELDMLSNNYSSSWFLTVFSSCLQERKEVLYEVWDYFLVKGWKFAFRVALHLLISNMECNQQRLSEDNIRIFNAESIFNEKVLSNDFAKTANKIKVTSYLLEHLEKDFSLVLEESKCN